MSDADLIREAREEMDRYWAGQSSEWQLRAKVESALARLITYALGSGEPVAWMAGGIPFLSRDDALASARGTSYQLEPLYLHPDTRGADAVPVRAMLSMSRCANEVIDQIERLTQGRGDDETFTADVRYIRGLSRRLMGLTAHGQKIDPAAWGAEREALRLIHGFMLDTNAIGLTGAAENLARGIKQHAAIKAGGGA